MKRASRSITLVLVSSALAIFGCDAKSRSTSRPYRSHGSRSGLSGWFFGSGTSHSSSSSSHSSVSSTSRGGFGSTGHSFSSSS